MQIIQGVVGMEEAKKIFPGKYFFQFLSLFFQHLDYKLLVGSIFFGGEILVGKLTSQPQIQIFGIDKSTYYLVVVLGLLQFCQTARSVHEESR